MVTVIPPDEVRWLPILMTNLEDGAVTSRLARPMSTDHNPVPNSCVHDVPNLFAAPPLFIAAVVPWLGTEVLDVPVVFVDVRYGRSVERRSKESHAVLGGL